MIFTKLGQHVARSERNYMSQYLALCDGRPNSPALEPRVPAPVPPEPPVPPVPIVPPEVPRLDQPFMGCTLKLSWASRLRMAVFHGC